MIDFAAEKPGNPFTSVTNYLGRPGTLSEAARRALGAVRDDMTPWVTLVIGSSCPRTADDELGEILKCLPKELAEQLKNEEPLPDGRSASEVVQAFTRHLIMDRSTRHPGVLLNAPCAPDDVPEGDPLNNPDLNPLAHALVACALLTEAFYGILSLQDRPLSRGLEAAAPLGAKTPNYQQLVERYLDPAVTHLEPAELEQFRMNLNADKEVKRSFVLTLTEWCWLQILAKADAHHGWHELQSADALRNKRSIDAVLTSTNAESISETVKEISDTAASKAWKILLERAKPKAGSAGLRSSDFLWASAEMLLAQAKSRGDEEAKAKKQPVPVVFTTGFDVELESALLLQSNEPFLMAIPVRATAGPQDHERTVLCWLGCEVERRNNVATLDCITKPGKWHLLSNMKRFGFIEPFSSMPVVVHLSGCPSVLLPNLQNHDYEELCSDIFRYLDMDSDGPADLHLGHAIIMDEYLAFQQSTAETFLYPSTTGESKHVLTAGLPASVTGTDSSRSKRFWVLCGLHLDDLATRLRVATRSPRHPLTPTRPQGENCKSIYGVAVSGGLGKAEQDLLQWSGYDTIEADCRELLKHITSYTQEISPDDRSH